MKFLSFLASFFFALTLLTAQVETEALQSNERAFETFRHMKGSHNFSLGIGFPNLANSAFSLGEWVGYENEGKASPNFTFKYEYGINPDFGIGVHVGYYTAKTPTLVSNIFTGDIISIISEAGCGTPLEELLGLECDTIYATEDSEPAYDRIHATTLGVRIGYHREHFLGIQKLDVYGTALFGYSFIRTKRIGDESAEVKKSNLPNFVYNTSVGLRYFMTPKVGIYGEFGYGSLTVFNMGLTYRILPKKKM